MLVLMMQPEGDRAPLHLLPHGGSRDGDEEIGHLGTGKLRVEEVRWIDKPDVEEGVLNLRKMSEEGLTITDETLEIVGKPQHKQLELFYANSETEKLVNDATVEESRKSMLGDPHVLDTVKMEDYAEKESKLTHLNDHVVDLNEPNAKTKETNKELAANLCTLGSVCLGTEDMSGFKDSSVEGKIDENLPAFSIYRNIDTSATGYKMHQCHELVDPGALFISTGYELQNTSTDLKDPELENFQPDIPSIQLEGTVVGTASFPVQAEQNGNDGIIKKLDGRCGAETNNVSEISLVELDDDNKTDIIFIEEISCFDISQVTPKNPVEEATLRGDSEVFGEIGESTQAIKIDDCCHNSYPENREIGTVMYDDYCHRDKSNDPQTCKIAEPELQNSVCEELNPGCKWLQATGLKVNQQLSVVLPSLHDDTVVVKEESDKNSYANCENSSAKDVIIECILAEDTENDTHSIINTNIETVDLFEAKPKIHDDDRENEQKCNGYLSDEACIENVDKINSDVNCTGNISYFFNQNGADSLEASVQFLVDENDIVHVVAKAESQVVNIATETSVTKKVREELNTNKIDQDGASNPKIEHPRFEGKVKSSMEIQAQDSGILEGHNGDDYSRKVSAIDHQFCEEQNDILLEGHAHIILPDLDVQCLDIGMFEESSRRDSGETSNIHRECFEEEIIDIVSERQEPHVEDGSHSMDYCSSKQCINCRPDPSSDKTGLPTTGTNESSTTPRTEYSQGVVPQKPREVRSIHFVGGVSSNPDINSINHPLHSTEIEPAMNDAKRCTSQDEQSLTATHSEQGSEGNDEETDMDLSNWSTSEPAHAPLKNLLNLKSKQGTLNVPEWNVSKGNGHSMQHPVQGHRVKKTPTSKAAAQPVARRTVYKEWNSPARLPVDKNGKGSKRRGKSQWVPFMCCSYVNK